MTAFGFVFMCVNVQFLVTYLKRSICFEIIQFDKTKQYLYATF